MKKIILIVIVLSLTLILSCATVGVNAAEDTITFNPVHSGVKEYTGEYGTTAYSYFWVRFHSIEDGEGNNTCTTTSNTMLKVTQRSVAGATGSTVYVLRDDAKEGGNAFYYGDEDVYYEVTLLNVNGDCKITIVLDTDYN